MPVETVFAENLHYVPDTAWPLTAFTVLRAGKVAAGATYGVRRASQVGQDVLFCLSGSGAVELGSRRVEVQAGEVVWIANEAPHAHIADARDPWTLLWFRFDGPNPAAVRTRLFGEGVPRVAASDRTGLVAWFERLFLVLRRRDRNLDFHLNQLVSEFFLLMARSLAAPASRGASDPLSAVVAAVRADIRHSWSATEIARLGGLSPSQTRRLFQKDVAGKSAALAHPRAADRSTKPHDSRERAHRQHRGGLRVLRRVSLRPRIQTGRGRLARRVAADGTRRERHVADANPSHSRPAQPVDLARGRLFGAERHLTLRLPNVGCTSGIGGICQVPVIGMPVSRLIMTSITVGTFDRIASR